MKFCSLIAPTISPRKIFHAAQAENISKGKDISEYKQHQGKHDVQNLEDSRR